MYNDPATHQEFRMMPDLMSYHIFNKRLFYLGRSRAEWTSWRQSRTGAANIKRSYYAHNWPIYSGKYLTNFLHLALLTQSKEIMLCGGSWVRIRWSASFCRIQIRTVFSLIRNRTLLGKVLTKEYVSIQKWQQPPSSLLNLKNEMNNKRQKDKSK